MQGMFLALASVISRLIGLFYRVPLTAIIGKSGNDNYGTAFSIYNILLIISSYSLPLAISKMVATRIAEGKAKEARRVLNLGLVFATFSGGIAFLTVFLGADYFAGEILKTPYAAIALKVLSPALLIVALLGVLRGFFQGLGTMVPSALSQIVEQIINAIVSVVAAYILVGVGERISLEMRASYGAAGGTLGTVSGAGIALIFMIVLKLLYNKRFKKAIAADKSKSKESLGSVFAVLILTIIPVLLSSTLYNISGIIDQGIYKNLAVAQGYPAGEISDSWGVFTGQYNVLINIPLAIANAIAASIVPSLAGNYKRKEWKELRSKIRQGLRFINIISFPCMFGFIALAQPLMRLLFADADPYSGYMLIVGAISVVFYSISTLTNGVLQGIDKMRIPVIHAAISLVLQAGLLYTLMIFLDLNIFAVIIANIFYAFLMCILNERSVKKYTGLKYSSFRVYVYPFISSFIMGIFVFLIYHGLYILLSNNTVATLVSILFGMIIYYVVMCLLGGIRESDLKRVPKGALIIRISKKIGFFKTNG